MKFLIKYTPVFFFLLIQHCALFSKKESYDIMMDLSAKELKNNLLKNYKGSGKKVLAIASFARTDLIRPNARYRSVIPRLGIYYANALQNEMFQPDRFILVERQRIDGLLDEVSYQQLGIVGKSIESLDLGGAELILLGTMQRREESIRVDARIVSLKTGTVVSVGTSLVRSSKEINKLYEDYPEAIREHTGVVIASSEWQTIDAPLYPPSVVTITAKGNWSMTNSRKNFDALGISSNPSYFGDYRVSNLYNHGQLICRLNTDPESIFTLGKIQILQKGYIECRINDSDLENNVGSQSVTLFIDERNKK